MVSTMRHSALRAAHCARDLRAVGRGMKPQPSQEPINGKVARDMNTHITDRERAKDALIRTLESARDEMAKRIEALTAELLERDNLVNGLMGSTISETCRADDAEAALESIVELLDQHSDDMHVHGSRPSAAVSQARNIAIAAMIEAAPQD